MWMSLRVLHISLDPSQRARRFQTVRNKSTIELKYAQIIEVTRSLSGFGMNRGGLQVIGQRLQGSLNRIRRRGRHGPFKRQELRALACFFSYVLH